MGAAWTDERIAELKQLHIDGYSGTQIAQKLGGGISRSAVLGKLHRLGLAGSPIKRRIGAPRTPRVYRPQKQVLVARLLPPLELNGKPYTALTIPYSGACKYPYDNAEAEGGYIFCGHPVSVESPYCSHHSARCFTPASNYKRKVDWRAPQLPRAA